MDAYDESKEGAMSTFDSVKDVLAAKLDIKVDGITPDTKLESLEMDSLDKIEVLFGLEETFNIKEIPHREVPLETVGDLVAIVDRFVAEQLPKFAAGGG